MVNLLFLNAKRARMKSIGKTGGQRKKSAKKLFSINFPSSITLLCADLNPQNPNSYISLWKFVGRKIFRVLVLFIFNNFPSAPSPRSLCWFSISVVSKINFLAKINEALEIFSVSACSCEPEKNGNSENSPFRFTFSNVFCFRSGRYLVFTRNYTVNWSFRFSLSADASPPFWAPFFHSHKLYSLQPWD